MFSYDGLNENMKQLVNGARHYALQGVYPPIRRDISSLTSRFLDWARPSSLGKWTRLAVREKGGQFLSHNKRDLVGGGVSLLEAKIVAAVGLTVFTGGTALAGIGAAGAVFAITQCLNLAYKKYKRHQATETASSISPTERIRGLLGLLNYGDIQELAHRTEKAVDHEKKFRVEREATHGFLTCVDAVRVTWRYERWYKRVEESIANNTNYQNLCLVNNGLQDICCDAVAQLTSAGVELTKYYSEAQAVDRGTASRAVAAGTIPDEGYFFWDEWFEAVSRGREDRDVLKGNFQMVLNEAREKSGISVSALREYGRIVKENLTSGDGVAAQTGQSSLSAISSGSLSEVMSGHFRSMITQIGSASAQSVATALGTIGVTSGVSVLASIGASIWNDDHNMNALSTKTGGSELAFTDRVFMLKSILEHGRMERLSASLGSLGADLDVLDYLKSSLVTINQADGARSAASAAAAREEAKEMAVMAYRVHKHLLEILTLAIWVSRLVSEVGGMLLEMIDGTHGLKNSENAIKRQLMELDSRGHSHCKGTCYGVDRDAQWYPLSDTDASLPTYEVGIEMTDFGRAA